MTTADPATHPLRCECWTCVQGDGPWTIDPAAERGIEAPPDDVLDRLALRPDRRFRYTFTVDGHEILRYGYTVAPDMGIALIEATMDVQRAYGDFPVEITCLELRP